MGGLQARLPRHRDLSQSTSIVLLGGAFQNAQDAGEFRAVNRQPGTLTGNLMAAGIVEIIFH